VLRRPVHIIDSLVVADLLYVYKVVEVTFAKHRHVYKVVEVTFAKHRHVYKVVEVTFAKLSIA
jgi:hypothetical protein